MHPGPPLEYARTGDGVTIAYLAVGQTGPTVVWMPSLGNLVAQWRVPMLRQAYLRLAESFRLVLYDGRGTGASDRRIDPAGLGLDGQLRDLTAVVDAVSPSGQVALIGYYHSVPASIAFAAGSPGRVSRMLLFGGALRLRDSMSPQQTQALLSLIDQDWDLFAESAAQAWMGWAAGESGRLIAESFRTAVTPTTARALFDAAREIDVTDLAAGVRAAALVVHRQSDRQMPVEVSRRLADALPQGRLEILEGSTPTLFFEHPDRDLDLVTRFLAGGDRGPAAPAGAPDGLTPRELAVLRLIAAGDSNAEIARGLGISVHTVERHAVNVYRKIGARGRTDAAGYAYAHGLA